MATVAETVRPGPFEYIVYRPIGYVVVLSTCMELEFGVFLRLYPIVLKPMRSWA